MTHSFSSEMTSPMRSARLKSRVGYRFHPTDEELVGHFLMRKLLGYNDEDVPIPEIKVCNFEPWDLPDLLKQEQDDLVCHFFSPRDYKYLGSLRSNRTTKAGFWKPTGKPRNVIDSVTKNVIGTKKSLVFYVKDHPKPVRTKWIMHEYDLPANSNSTIKRSFLLYKLKVKPDGKVNEGDPNYMASPAETESQNLSVITEVGNEHQNEMSTDFTCDGTEPSYQLVNDPENSSPNDVTSMSPYESVLMSPDFENQNVHNAAESTTLEVETIFDELEALLELDDIINSELFSPISTEGDDLSYSYARNQAQETATGILFI
ncbi:NAC domain-containing protein 83-like [Mercurialis annua]|uniref:NAC domain-containing protein 83-like n=1 Tax=Mercurialis annua TaxID=3986 RepID=UPI002160AE28|nr:NAC domain-containing protein 83-like [Mercurialis annua]